MFWKLQDNLLFHCLLLAGVSSLISLLASAREEDQPRLNVLLCEAVVAVYLSLLIHGLGTHSGNELFRLAAHPLNNRMWAAVFGGGAKVIIKPKRPEGPTGRGFFNYIFFVVFIGVFHHLYFPCWSFFVLCYHLPLCYVSYKIPLLSYLRSIFCLSGLVMAFLNFSILKLIW